LNSTTAGADISPQGDARAQNSAVLKTTERGERVERENRIAF